MPKETPPIVVSPVRVGERETGLLAGPGDVVFYEIFTYPLDDYFVTLWDNEDENDPAKGDFDLYFRCGALPTETNYDLKATTPDSMEFIRLRAEEICPFTPGAPPSIFMAVVSDLGIGQYNLLVSPVVKDATIRVGIEVSAAGAPLPDVLLEAIRGSLPEVSKLVFAFTEGQYFFRKWEVWKNVGKCDANHFQCGGQPCDLCFTDGCWLSRNGETMCGLLGEALDSGRNPDLDPRIIEFAMWQVYNYNDPSTARDSVGIAHEFAHLITQGFDEKFGEPRLTYCGHSFLGNVRATNMLNLCTGVGHAKDGVADNPAASQDSAWIKAARQFHQFYLTTPDQYDFLPHDFNDSINVNIIN